MSFKKRRGVAEQNYKREADWNEAGVFVFVEIILYELRKKARRSRAKIQARG